MRTLHVDRYFKLLSLVEEAIGNNQFETAVRYSREGIQLVPDVIAETIEEYGSFNIVASPVVERGAMLLALAGDRSGLETLRNNLACIPPENPLWVVTNEWLKATDLIENVLARVTKKPGIHQLDLRDEFASNVHEKFREVCYWLARTGKINRKRSGRSYALWPTASDGRIRQ
ncbi:MAG TPA: hypothetical protein VH280_17365 [Verrucomicrobiae bacterium]|jgi:hypothetical protein|nr:hypothetical protein [Verrucomicrobiae bacterium]